MSTMENKITAAFGGGETRCRELRLSEVEAAYLRAHYAAIVRPMGDGWYEITLKGVGNQ